MPSNEQATPDNDPLLTPIPQEAKWDEWLSRLNPKTRKKQRSASRESRPVEPPQYYLLYLPSFSGDMPRLEPLPTLSALVERIKEILLIVGPEDQLFLFYGKRLQISKGSNPYLVLPGDAPIPLFDDTRALELADDGQIGAGWPELPDPAQTTREEDDYEYVDFYEDDLVSDPGQRPIVGEEPSD